MKIRIAAFATVAALALFPTSNDARAEAPSSLTIDLAVGGTLDLVLVKGGTFTQGSPAIEKGRAADEAQRNVTLSDFYVGKTLVTRRQFGAFVSATAYRTEAERGTSGGHGWDGTTLVQKKEFTWKNPGFAQTDDDPVTIVTYDDAMAFVGWASQRAQRRLALPTEAQFEYAARAGTTSAYYAGHNDEDALGIGWFKKNAGNGTRPVASKTPNAFGLYDMSGDVAEWCRDFYAPYPLGDATDPVVDAPPATDTPRRVQRGGSWLKDVTHGRSAARARSTPGSRNADDGFRVASSDLVGKPAFAPTALPPAPLQVPLTTSPTNAPSSGPGFGAIALLVLGGGVAALLFAFLRGRGRPAGIPTFGSGPGDVSVRVVDDGFWLGAGLPAGTRVKYTCSVRGVPVTDTVNVDGGARGTFVYTGGAPVNVRILEVTSVDDDYPRGGGGPMYRGANPNPVYVGVPVRNDDPPAPSPQPFGGYPPAY